MKTHLRVLAIVVFILVIGCGTASAYSKTNMQSVVVNIDGAPRMISTDKETVGEVLKDLDKTIDTEYFLNDAEESDPIEAMMTISLTSVTEKTTAETKEIPFKTIERANPKMALGTKKVVQEGQNGISSLFYKNVYHGSELIETKFVEEKVTVPVQNKIVEYGTTGMIHGHAYTKQIQAKVTAYTPFDAGCNGITATGTTAKKGVIAVDPNVIPLGTRVYIPGYGVAVAQDTGGAIKGNRIDVCYMTKNEAFSWGVRNVPVYILQ
jgi:3D (Asp-Asp-Asp) domain-containing protein